MCEYLLYTSRLNIVETNKKSIIQGVQKKDILNMHIKSEGVNIFPKKLAK